MGNEAWCLADGHCWPDGRGVVSFLNLMVVCAHCSKNGMLCFSGCILSWLHQACIGVQ